MPSSRSLDLLCACSGFVCLFSGTSAAEKQGAALSSLDLEQLVQLPVEVVSGVSKFNQPTRQAPASVTVLTSDDIRNYGWRTLADALRTTPGFHIRDDRFYEYVGNRGFTRAYDYNSRTLVLVDGHKINDPIYQQGSVGTEFLLDPDLIERIEIIRGPGSSLYGSSAFYGAINVIPKKGRTLSGGQAALTVDSTPGAKSRVSYGDRTDAGVEYLVSATGSDSHGESGFVLPDSWRAATGLADLKTSSEDATRQQQVYAHASYRGIETEAAYGRREKDVLPSVYTTLPGANAADTRAYWLARISGEICQEATIEAKTSIDYYGYDGHFIPRVDTDSDGAPDAFHRHHSTASSVSLNHEVLYHQLFKDSRSFLLGVEIQNNLRQKTSNPDLDDPALSAKSISASSSYISPFAQLDYQICEPLHLSIGGRYDKYSTGESKISPRTGLIWDATRSTAVKLLYGESFRVPNLEERYPTEPGISSNPYLGPEANQSWEIVAETQISPAWSADAHIYRTESSGLIINYTNFADFTTTGTELGLTSHFKNGFQLRTSATYQRTHDDKDDCHVRGSPRFLGKINLSAPIYSDWLRASFEAQYVGRRSDFSKPAEIAEDYLTGNFTLRASPLWHRWEIALSVYNVADARWSDPKNTGQISSPPRSAMLRVMRDF